MCFFNHLESVEDFGQERPEVNGHLSHHGVGAGMAVQALIARVEEYYIMYLVIV